MKRVRKKQMHNTPTVDDAIWLESLSSNERERLKRLFNTKQSTKTYAQKADAAYNRGVTYGLTQGQKDTLRELQTCAICAEYGIRKCLMHNAKI